MPSIRLVLVAALLLLLATFARGEEKSLDGAERDELRKYIATLAAGARVSADATDRLADVPFDGLLEVMKAYSELEGPEPHTHRAFQVLLERMSRSALAPWPMIELYSPPLAAYLTSNSRKAPYTVLLGQQLLRSGTPRLSADLAVRLVPHWTLRIIADARPRYVVELLSAWNRRLGRGREDRPIPDFDKFVAEITTAFRPNFPPAEVEARLLFAALAGSNDRYEQQLASCLASDDEGIVKAALSVQQRVPARLDLNLKLIAQFEDNEPFVEAAVRNFAFDDTRDWSAELRTLWSKIPKRQNKARYACLFAMGVHYKGNDSLALDAVREQSYYFIDVARPILAHGDRDKARQAIEHVLTKSDRGHEEALRLASELALTGFEKNAEQIARDGSREQIERQAAFAYLERAPGAVRKSLLPYLSHPNADLRLAAIKMYANKEGLSAEDREAIGPALIRVALNDKSQGHRQEAAHALGNWRERAAGEFFRKLLFDNPPVLMQEGHYSDERYWQYRMRLVALLALVKLGDDDARQEMLALHDKGGPQEKMDVLLAFHDLGEMHPKAFDDLTLDEPKLVATAALVIRRHGNDADRTKLRQWFDDRPLWREFIGSGLDDHGILEIAGLVEDGGNLRAPNQARPKVLPRGKPSRKADVKGAKPSAKVKEAAR